MAAKVSLSLSNTSRRHISPAKGVALAVAPARLEYLPPSARPRLSTVASDEDGPPPPVGVFFHWAGKCDERRASHLSSREFSRARKRAHPIS